jgi:hypothetical protein
MARTRMLILALTLGTTVGPCWAQAQPVPVAPAKPALPSGWHLYSDLLSGFDVYAPAAPPKKLDIPAQPSVKGVAYMFMFENDLGMGQVMTIEYTGPGGFDLEKGLDGSVTGSVTRMGATMTRVERTEYHKRPARRYSFTLTVQGRKMNGWGFSVGSAARTVKTALSIVDLTKPQAEFKAHAFVDSFQPR